MSIEGCRKTKCKWCGKIFFAKNNKKQTCSYKCTLNYNKKQKEKYEVK